MTSREMRKELLKELMKPFLLVIVGSLWGYFGEPFKPQKATFEIIVCPTPPNYKVQITNELEKMEGARITMTFFTGVEAPTAVLNSGGRTDSLEGERSSDDPLVYVFDSYNAEPITLRPSDVVTLETRLRDTTVNVRVTRKPEACLFSDDFPKVCSTTRERVRWTQILGGLVFFLIAFVAYRKPLLTWVDLRLRASIFYLKYRKRKRKNSQEAEEFFVERLIYNDHNACCFFRYRYERKIRRCIKYVLPRVEEKDQNEVFTVIVCSIRERLSQYDYSTTTVTQGVWKLTDYFLDAILEEFEDKWRKAKPQMR